MEDGGLRRGGGDKTRAPVCGRRHVHVCVSQRPLFGSGSLMRLEPPARARVCVSTLQRRVCHILRFIIIFFLNRDKSLLQRAAWENIPATLAPPR